MCMLNLESHPSWMSRWIPASRICFSKQSLALSALYGVAESPSIQSGSRAWYRSVMLPAASWCASSRTTSSGLSPSFRRISLAPSRSNMERGWTLAVMLCLVISSTTCPSKNRRMATHITVASDSSSQSSWATSSPMKVLPEPVGDSIMMELIVPSLISPIVWLMMRCW